MSKFIVFCGGIPIVSNKSDNTDTHSSGKHKLKYDPKKVPIPIIIEAHIKKETKDEQVSE